jgi:hypothetical protein
VLALTEGQLTESEADFVENRLALPIGHAVEAAMGQQGYNRCSLLQDQIVLDHLGNVNLCCTVYDFKKNGLGNFLEMSGDDLKSSKRRHPTCDTCVSKGLHKYFVYFDIPELKEKYERLAETKVEEREALAQGAGSRSIG